jgi:hypothetical protein
VTQISSNQLYLNLYKCSATKRALGRALAVVETTSIVVVLVEQIFVEAETVLKKCFTKQLLITV